MINDRPEVRALMEYLTTPHSISAFLERGGHLSPHRTASVDMYGRDLERDIALEIAYATVFRFDVSDIMSEETVGAFFRYMFEYVSGATEIDSALKEIDATLPE